MKRKVVFVTGSRADYGIMRNYLSLMNQDEEIDLKVLVTGALLEDKYGHQVDLVYEDGFNIEAEIKLPLETSSDMSVLHSMAVALDEFSKHFHNNPCDLLIILGDRYEMMSVSIAVAMQKIPILHIHGGEATFGNYDEFIRHCITKMSAYHIAATEVYKNRIIQLGEQPERVYNLGALGAENCLEIDEKNVPDIVKELDNKKYFVVLFHPETLTNVDVLSQVNALLDAISEYKNLKFVFLGSNADTSSDIIRKRIHEYVENNANAMYFENLHTNVYHFLVKNSICLIGNSSSGIIEAPSLGVYTINIGNRQKGRVRGNSVIDVECTKEEILNAIESVLEKYEKIQPVNPYFQENAANRYYDVTKKILESIGNTELKVFYDLKNN